MKWPRTYHIPGSPGATKDDKILDKNNYENLLKKDNLIITEKLDGECTVMSKESIHARSEDSKDHESRHWVKKLWGEVKFNIPKDVYIIGENVYAKHSIFYNKLDTYFYIFSIIEDNKILSIPDTFLYCEMLGLNYVPIFKTLINLNENDINFELDNQRKSINSLVGEVREGFVIRNSDEFLLKHMKFNMVKWVRSNHVITDDHWMYLPMIVNKLKD